MGVPAFFRWLSGKYDKILQQVIEVCFSQLKDTANEACRKCFATAHCAFHFF
jgi:5'-3' exonuclease